MSAQLNFLFVEDEKNKNKFQWVTPHNLLDREKYECEKLQWS